MSTEWTNGSTNWGTFRFMNVRKLLSTIETAILPSRLLLNYCARNPASTSNDVSPNFRFGSFDRLPKAPNPSWQEILLVQQLEDHCRRAVSTEASSGCFASQINSALFHREIIGRWRHNPRWKNGRRLLSIGPDKAASVVDEWSFGSPQ